MLSDLLQDTRQSLRAFRQNPGFALTAIAALALGIGANTAIFSVVNAVLLKPVPFPHPERLLMIMSTSPTGSEPLGSSAKFAHWSRQTSVIEDVAAFRSGVVNYTGSGGVEQLRLEQVSAAYFRCFGTPVIRGRPFTPEEDRPQGPRSALISEGLWQRRFGRDEKILGSHHLARRRAICRYRYRRRVVRLARIGPAPEVFTAFQLDPGTSDHGDFFEVAAHLRPGVTLEQAKAQFQVAVQDFRRRFPTGILPQEAFTVTPFREAYVGDFRRWLLLFAGAVGLVLLIACVNVASLLLVRAAGRRVRWRSAQRSVPVGVGSSASF